MNIHKTQTFLISLFLLFVLTLSSFNKQKKEDTFKSPPFIGQHDTWVDSVFNSLTLDEKIGQLFMVATYSNKDSSHIKYITKLIKEDKIGGLIFFEGNPYKQAVLTNYYQTVSKTPLMIAIDAEWGLAMRLDSTVKYPKQLMLGAIQDNELIYNMSEHIAKQMRRLGVHINFAPDIDINNNPDNPVINFRSFGENRNNVSQKGIAYMQGLQDNNILAVGKHFPGHGDTKFDSHKTLPTINHTRQHLFDNELYPFQQLINNGLGGIMVAHLFVPAFDSTIDRASTLSKVIVTDLLKKQMAFKGLVFTDALNMRGVRNYYTPDEINILAIKAGNNVLVFPDNVGNAIKNIKTAIEKGEIPLSKIETSCKKILMAKRWFGLNQYQPVKLKGLNSDLNSSDAKKTNIELVESAITLLNNKNRIIPLQQLDTLKIASVAIGNGKIKTFQTYLNKYTYVKKLALNKHATKKEIDSLHKKLKNFNLIIVSIHNTSQSPSGKYGITKTEVEFVTKLAIHKNVILDVFANPYSLNSFKTSNLSSVILSYEDSRLSQALSAQLIFGGIKALGKLPVSLNKFNINSGIVIDSTIRLKYTIPEDLCIEPNLLIKVDSLAENAITNKATPGCQILCAKDGKVFYEKSFGYYTYDSINKVRNNNIYDLASITKVAATTLLLMKMYDEQKLLPNDLLSEHICALDTTNKKKMKLDDILRHQASLKAWMPFYRSTIVNSLPDSAIYSRIKSDDYSIQVADSLYITKDYSESLFDSIFASPLRDTNDYKYSDLGFFMFKKMIQNEEHTKLNLFVDSVFYKPLGLKTMGFLPLKRNKKGNIVPTEWDTVFRKQLLQGYVHDQGAAMLGGVGGHAGLFSDANDLAIIMQMLMNYGRYGGKQFINAETVKLFTTTSANNPNNRRALGFDKPEMDYSKEGPTCQCVSDRSFGHTGFTGTIAWADPVTKIVYIFLSNRVYPNQNNAKLVEMNVRTNIQQAFYDAIYW
ncbi:MAG: serine hydrolase [Chlorobi bacterium]|nr:serine hydrolase [Chlorobiota bacterium]